MFSRETLIVNVPNIEELRVGRGCDITLQLANRPVQR